MAFNFKNVVLTSDVIGKGKNFLLLGAKEWKEFDRETQKTTDKVLGMKYTCAVPGNGFQNIVVKVKEGHDPVTQKEIDEEPNTLVVNFENFAGKIYMNNFKQPDLSCEADDINVVSAMELI
ncbi:hypothetical protein [Bacillus toyonensis]|uniref:hypothetical protein n=1 Tax=Bacillus toyonensis TaxID=155322 RepID=UPI001C0D442C|nr:hypothetical protein [Bacillus toyonensis]MBU4643157.1 hypothetical protein [Bacillus toyonensis]